MSPALTLAMRAMYQSRVGKLVLRREGVYRQLRKMTGAARVLCLFVLHRRGGGEMGGCAGGDACQRARPVAAKACTFSRASLLLCAPQTSTGPTPTAPRAPPTSPSSWPPSGARWTCRRARWGRRRAAAPEFGGRCPAAAPVRCGGGQRVMQFASLHHWPLPWDTKRCRSPWSPTPPPTGASTTSSTAASRTARAPSRRARTPQWSSPPPTAGGGLGWAPGAACAGCRAGGRAAVHVHTEPVREPPQRRRLAVHLPADPDFAMQCAAAQANGLQHRG